ncbi:MAG: Ig-like domain-containing protein, partial [Gemmatimonadota bacterium]|nr:Ig-like domain-containing protein [Gemmatimonadota bacterium]
MRHQRLLLAISAVISATIWVYACGDGATEPAPLPPDPPRPTTVTVSPATAQLTALGATVQLSAEVRDQNGQVIAGATVTWASNAATVATVSVSGLVTAVANGSATITATAGSASGNATVTVAQEASNVAVTPAETTIAALGDTVRLAAEALDANGNAIAGTEFSWESSDATVATVDASGLVTAMADGSAMITATAGSASGSATVTVAQEASTVALAPAEASIAALGDTLRLTAEALDANGNAVAGAEFSWESSDDAVATVDTTGLVTSVASGIATITATTGSVSGSAIVSVAQEVRAVVVAPDTATVLAGDTLRLVATATDANGQAVTGIAFAWASGDTTVAVVDASGLVTGVGAGQVQVTAAAAGATGRAQLAVVAPVPTTVAVTPDTVVLTAVGQTAQLNAEVRDQAGRSMDGVPVAWSSADTTVAVVDSAGLVSAVGGGVATITARAGEASGDALVTVVQSVDSVTVSPPADTIAPGDSLRLVAAAYDENGHVLEGASFTWSSSNVAVATVDASGLVRGAGEGTATVTAAAGDASGTSGITVTNPDRAALVALYNATDGPNWVDNTNWLTDAPLGEWYGVTTDALGRVVQIVLGGRWDNETQRDTSHGLRGELPPELGRLSNLEILALSRNDLLGKLPPDLGNLAELWMLRLASNKLTGPIPPELANLAKLRSLDLSHNDLTGGIPPELGGLAELFSLILEGNALLTGPIPPELGNLANLDRLLLGWSNLGGSIPPELGNLSKLKTLSLYDAKLTGPIPPELGNLSELTYLELGVNGLTGAIPSELGHLSALTTLSLPSNNVTGVIPSELGHLSALTWLNLSNNNLTGSVPRSFLQLNQLRSFFVRGQDVCVPGISALALWFEGIESRDTDRVFCNAAEVAALESLYRGTGGVDWAASGGWLANHGVEEWYGVTADSLGHVTELDLEGNGLTGQLPAALGDMPQMTVLRIADNDLSGRIPRGFTSLPLVEFRYAQTELCASRDASFQGWLNAIVLLEGTGVNCDPPSTDREILEILYNETGGPDWTNNANWLTDAPLRTWYGVDVDGEGRVSGLSLVVNNFVGNNLTGRIPPELGSLAALEHLSLHSNDLSGEIPPELGNLARLRELRLWFNNLTGSIPPELGNLAALRLLGLSDNNLTGRIPPELGNLAELRQLNLYSNDLSGEIPPTLGNLTALRFLVLDDNNLTGQIAPQLGNLTALGYLHLEHNNLTGRIPPELSNLPNLWWLSLVSNDLSGPVPPDLGSLTGLQYLQLANNPGLTGALPQSLARLDRLRRLQAGGTGLCAPTDTAFQAWLDGLQRFRIAPCTAGEPSTAYLTQAVQSREFPVPLVAGERALLRVFPTARQTTNAGIPLVRARFYVGGQETHVVDIPGKSDPIPPEVDEGSLSRSANAEIPARVIQPGLEMVIEVDPDGTLDPGLGVARRIPETGRLPVA